MGTRIVDWGRFEIDCSIPPFPPVGKVLSLFSCPVSNRTEHLTASRRFSVRRSGLRRKRRVASCETKSTVLDIHNLAHTVRKIIFNTEFASWKGTSQLQIHVTCTPRPAEYIGLRNGRHHIRNGSRNKRLISQYRFLTRAVLMRSCRILSKGLSLDALACERAYKTEKWG